MAAAEIEQMLMSIVNSPVMFNHSAYSFVRSMQDADGIFQRIVYNRRNGSKIAQSDLTNKVSGNYTTETMQFFADDGATVRATVRWTLAYNAQGELISKTYTPL